VGMQFEQNWVDSPLYTNNAAESEPAVRVSNNTLVAAGSGAWPAAARAVMAEAGARR
jgi:predicted RNase H-like nuclease